MGAASASAAVAYGFPKRKLLQLLQAALILLGVFVVAKMLFGTLPEKRPRLKKAVGKGGELVDAGDWPFDTSVRIDWHDWDQMDLDKQRSGPGEQGQAYKPEKVDKKLESEYYSRNAFNGLASDSISVDRSVNDIRHPDCRKMKYSTRLPTVSVIIPFINEHMSTLKRTFHSVINRSPRELLKEVILVDDFSNLPHLKEELETYIKETPVIRDLVRLVRLPERGGLVLARQAGAKAAKAQVLIFLDSHTEANYNWLPPLIEPIAEDYRTAVCPFIDVIDMDNFEYRAQDEGKRGSFDWELFYKRLDLLDEDLLHPTKPFRSPVMAGGLFAISAKFFWELGGYDEGLMIWGGEQYELSFKIWQCGGQMFDAPCSRVGHIYRKFAPFGSGGKANYLARNFKRVAEVWMDEYKENLYKRRPDYRSIDPGDISKQLELRNRLSCKPFKWFMEKVAFDQPFNYPAVEPADFATGFIRNDKHTHLCVSSSQVNDKFAAAECSESNYQKFVLNWHKDLRPQSRLGTCFDVSAGGNKAPVLPYECHGGKGNQLWRYDLDKKWLINGGNPRCLDLDVVTKELFVSECDENIASQKWTIENVNKERLREWDLKKL